MFGSKTHVTCTRCDSDMTSLSDPAQVFGDDPFITYRCHNCVSEFSRPRPPRRRETPWSPYDRPIKSLRDDPLPRQIGFRSRKDRREDNRKKVSASIADIDVDRPNISVTVCPDFKVVSTTLELKI